MSRRPVSHTSIRPDYTGHTCGLDLERIGKKFQNADVADPVVRDAYQKEITDVYERCAGCRVSPTQI